MNVWNGVCEFVAVAESESFTKAAKQLSLSVAQVSRQVSALEQRLKVKLFHRTTRRVSLTESGSSYYRYCQKILKELSEAEQSISQQYQKAMGNIKISAPITYGEEVITPLVNNFLLQYPDITIELLLSNKRVDLIEEGFDLAIRLGQLEDSALIARKLASRRLYLCATEGYIKKFGSPNTLEDLKDHNCLIGSADRWQFQLQGKKKQVLVQGRLRCNSGYGLLDAALKDLGIIQLPSFYLQPYIDSGQLVPLLEEFQTAEEGTWALYPDKQFLPFKIKLLLEYLIKHC